MVSFVSIIKTEQLVSLMLGLNLESLIILSQESQSEDFKKLIKIYNGFLNNQI